MHERTKVSLVTGASSGIGRAIALRLADQGWSVGLVARRAERLHEVAREIASRGGEAWVLAGDLRAPSFAGRVVEDLASRAGGLDLLVNNAGAPTPANPDRTWGDASDEQFDEAFALNVRAAYRLALSALPLLRERQGSIVNIGSAGVARNLAIDLVYLSSKGALEILSRGMARKWAPLGVRVNLVSPGIMPTEIMEAAGLDPLRARAEIESTIGSVQPLPRRGALDDVANAVAFLASPAAAFITGVRLHVDGGMALNG